MSGEAPVRLQVDLSSAVPVYRQIIDGTRALLVSGRLAPGHEMPGVRRLAIDLGVHFNTVAQAYRALADEGWLEVSHGRKVRVRAREAPAPPDRSEVESYRRRLRELAAEMRSRGVPASRIARELRSLAEAVE